MSTTRSTVMNARTDQGETEMTKLEEMCLAGHVVSSGATWCCNRPKGHAGLHDDGLGDRWTADLPDRELYAGWDEAEEGRPAPDCAAGLWLEASRWQPEHGQPDASGYLIPPPGARCVGCGRELSRHPQLLAPVYGSDGQHYHCDHCACYLDDAEG